MGGSHVYYRFLYATIVAGGICIRWRIHCAHLQRILGQQQKIVRYEIGVHRYYPFEIGDVVITKDSSDQMSVILSVEPESDCVVHRCLKTGMVYEKSYLTFPAKYVKQALKSHPFISDVI